MKVELKFPIKDGEPVRRGTPGSIRVDLIEGPRDRPTKIYDFKFGEEGLPPGREMKIRQNLPRESRHIPIIVVRPREGLEE